MNMGYFEHILKASIKKSLPQIFFSFGGKAANNHVGISYLDLDLKLN